MFQCEWLKRPTPLCHPLTCPLSFYPSPPPAELPTTLSVEVTPWFEFDPCLPSAPLSNFPKANIQSLTWKDGKYFAKGRRRGMEDLFKERNFSAMRDIVWNGPKQNLGLRRCQKMASSETGTWTRVSQMVSLARTWSFFLEEGFILAAFSFLCVVSCFRLLFLSTLRQSMDVLCSSL